MENFIFCAVYVLITIEFAKKNQRINTVANLLSDFVS